MENLGCFSNDGSPSMPQSRVDAERMVEDLTGQIKAREDISGFKTHAQAASRSWCSILNSLGHNLLQTAITYNSAEAFDLLLPFYEAADLEMKNKYGESALMIAAARRGGDFVLSEYFVTELIKSGACVHTRCETTGETCLHVAILASTVQVVNLLIDEGVDVNAQDKNGNTALHTILKIYQRFSNFDEKVALLMYYNADPLIENELGYIPFEYTVHCFHEPELQEMLFSYTFDKDTNARMNIDTLVRVAYKNPGLFSKIMKCKLRVYLHDQTDSRSFFVLLNLNRECLTRLARKCGSTLGKLMVSFPRSLPSGLIHIPMTPYARNVASRLAIRNLDILLESRAKPGVLFFIQNLDSRNVVAEAVKNNNEDKATKVLLFYVSHGMAFDDSAYHTVYEKFGYCNLFRMLLYIGLREPLNTCVKSTIPCLMYDFNHDLNTLMERRVPVYDPSLVIKFPYGNPTELLDHFAGPKLTDFLQKRNEEEHFSEETLMRVRNHPKVPRLVELARDSFRKHLIKTFGITSSGQFYTYIEKLPVSRVYKEIITYETKLY